MYYVTIALNWLFVAACCYGGQYFYKQAKLIESFGKSAMHEIYGGTMWIAFVLCVGFGFIYLNNVASCLIEMFKKKPVA